MGEKESGKAKALQLNPFLLQERKISAHLSGDFLFVKLAVGADVNEICAVIRYGVVDSAIITRDINTAEVRIFSC